MLLLNVYSLKSKFKLQKILDLNNALGAFYIYIIRTNMHLKFK